MSKWRPTHHGGVGAKIERGLICQLVTSYYRVYCLPSVHKESLLSVFEACVGELEIGVRGDTNVGTMLATYGWLGRSQSTRPDSVPDSGPYRDISTFNTAHVVTTEDKIR